MSIKNCILLLNFIFGCFISGISQTTGPELASPDGEAVIATALRSGGIFWDEKNYVVTSKAIYVYQTNASGQASGKPLEKYIVKGDKTIVDATPKYGQYYGGTTFGYRLFLGLLITLSDGTKFSYAEDHYIKYGAVVWLDPNEPPKQMIGDDLYAISNHLCFVARDTPACVTWVLDTNGVGNNFKYNLALDSNQRVYLATQTGLYMQVRNSNQWIKNNNLPGTNCNFVFIDDRKHRIFAYPSGGLKVSVDNGLSFQNAPTGITGSITAMCADIYGNIYCISNKRIYKSISGTQPFVTIDQNILNQISEPADLITFKSIDADSTLVLGTKYGVFSSADQGGTWAISGVPAMINYGIAKTASGRLVVSNNMGIHTREANNLQWTKRLPSSSVEAASKIFNDNNGNLYTTSQSNKLIWKSTDNGSTWNLDTSSMMIIPGNIYSFYVDPQGNQHAFVQAAINRVYTKNTGAQWTIDTVGLKGINFSTPTAWGTDNNGNLYLATTAALLQKRPITGGAWVMDTSGLNSQAFIYDLATEPNGTLWAGTYVGAYKRVAGVWQQLAYPTGTQTGVTNSCFVVSVDGAGAIWTQWSYYNTLGHAIGSGVYFTMDGGTTWKTMDFDTITFRQLYSFGDTTYAVSYADGLFRFARNAGPNGLKRFSIDESVYDILVYPNPGLNELTIKSNSGLIQEIEITNELGDLVMKRKSTDVMQTTFDISNLAKGVYIIEVRGKDFKVGKQWVKE